MRKIKFKDNYILKMPFDINLILDIIFLNIFGIIMIYSASYYYAVNTYHQASTYFFGKQIGWVAGGLVLMLIVASIRTTLYKALWIPALVAVFLFIFAVRVPGLGYASHGAYRWILISGFRLQVAEPIKICLIVAMAGYMSKYNIKNRRCRYAVILAALAVFVFLWLVTSNMSTALIVAVMVFFTMMVNDIKPNIYLYIMFGALVMVVLLILIIDKVIPYDPDENFRITRCRAWLHPSDPQFAGDTAYQSTQALYAIASGGFFGKGLGQSLIKFVLPEPHNDYILAIIFEELGIFGVMILTYLFLYLLYKIFIIYRDCHDRFSRILVLGIFLHFSAQLLMNYAVTLGLFPTMGVTLPFISAGGSAAFFSLLELGMVLAVERQNLERKFYIEATKELENEDPNYKTVLEEERERHTGRARRPKERR